jgi:hypothetical protein
MAPSRDRDLSALVLNCTLKPSPAESNGELAGGLIDIGFTVPGQAWTYWNRGPGPGKSYLEDEAGRDWSHATGRAAASNLVAAARALRAQPIPAPPSE